MANNNNGNGKNKIEVSLSKELNERVESYAEDKGQSVQSIARVAIESHLDKCDTKSVLKKACFEDETLRAESKTCKYLEEEHN
jgi:hypothetical protein